MRYVEIGSIGYLRGLFRGRLSRVQFVVFLVGAAAVAIAVRTAIYVIPQFALIIRAFIEHPQYVDGFPTFAIGEVIALIISLRAKPIGDRPYHWGMFLGIMTGVRSLEVLLRTLSGFRNQGDVLAATISGALTIWAGAAAAGLIFRRRWGVAASMTLYGFMVAVFLSPPQFLSILRNIPEMAGMPFKEPFSERLFFSGVLCLYLAANGVYFKNRWNLMGAGRGTK